jgi:hypothetical protein
MGGDPVEEGLVARLNRPEGNVTGVAILAAEIAAKRLASAMRLRSDESVIAFRFVFSRKIRGPASVIRRAILTP